MARVGVLGASSVVERALVRPAAALPGVEVLGVASSDPARARRLAETLGLPRTWPDHASLLEDSEVDAVYVALHNSAHAEWALRAVRAGKHVLVEKPLCLHRQDVEALHEAASATGVFVMEAVMTAHHPWLASLHECVTRQELGRLQRVEMELVFSTPEPSNYRCHPGLGGGILWDAGPYWAQLLQAVLGPLTPVSLRGLSDFSGPNGVDARFEAEVEFPGGVVARLVCAFGERHVAELRLLFEDGTLRHSQFLRPAVAPFRVNLHLTRHSTGERKVLSFPPEAYYPRQLEVFMEGLRRGTDGAVLAACRERVGLLEDLHADAWRRHGRAAP